jgi:RNA polymerase sigma-70 factor (ECF subfamily)
MTTSPPTDYDLLLAWRSGDAGAGHELFARHKTAVTNLLRRNVRDKDEIPDLVQQTFVACIEGKSPPTITNSVRSWLLGVAFFKMTHHFRKQRSAPLLGLAGPEDPGGDDRPGLTLASVEPDPEYLLQLGDERRLLMKALRRIKIEYQVIIELNYWEGVSCDEIAEILGLPRGTVRRRLQLGRDALERRLAELAESKALLETTTMSITAWKKGIHEWIAANKDDAADPS